MWETLGGDSKKLIKVPTLRNITETAPYFHNGMIWSLKDAIQEMSHVQVAYKIEGKIWFNRCK